MRWFHISPDLLRSGLSCAVSAVPKGNGFRMTRRKAAAEGGRATQVGVLRLGRRLRSGLAQDDKSKIKVKIKVKINRKVLRPAARGSG